VLAYFTSPNFLCDGTPKCVLKEHGNVLINHSVEVHSPSPTTPLSLQQKKGTTTI